MTNEEALSLGILALNTLTAPDATSDEDFAALDAGADEAVERLAELRQSAIEDADAERVATGYEFTGNGQPPLRPGATA